MKTIIVVGGSKGIGKAILQNLLVHTNVINISRSTPDVSHDNLIY